MRNETERVRGWVGSMYVADSLFYIWGHGHHCQFLNRTDSEGGYHCRFLNRTDRFLNRTDSEGGYHCRFLNRTDREGAYM